MEQARSGRKSDVLLINRHFAELNPVIVGQEVCAPGHRFGPSVRKYVLLHCVLSGKGTYTCGGVTYPVAAGQIFRILPGEETVYQADTRDPWHYAWIGFDGTLSEAFRTLPPVFPATPMIAQCFRMESNDTPALEYRIASKLFRLWAELFGSLQNMHYVRRVQNYIESSYASKIRVSEIAKSMNIDRSYLSRLFRERTGQSIQEYLIGVRMSEACRHLLEGRSVGETANLCGYDDSFLFSKLFRRHIGASPTHWRAANLPAEGKDTTEK